MIPQERGIKRGPRGYPFILTQAIFISKFISFEISKDILN
jgi:hypothetical protein